MSSKSWFLSQFWLSSWIFTQDLTAYRNTTWIAIVNATLRWINGPAQISAPPNFWVSSVVTQLLFNIYILMKFPSLTAKVFRNSGHKFHWNRDRVKDILSVSMPSAFFWQNMVLYRRLVPLDRSDCLINRQVNIYLQIPFTCNTTRAVENVKFMYPLQEFM